MRIKTVNVYQGETLSKRQARYLKNAAEAQELAKRAPEQRFRDGFTEIARAWLTLVLEAGRSRDWDN